MPYQVSLQEISDRGPLQVRAYGSLEETQHLLPAWEALLSEIPTATIFSTWEWLAPWWRAFGNAHTLMILAFFDSDQRLVALVPLSLIVLRLSGPLEFKILRLMGDGSGDSDNLDVPVRPGYEEAVVRGLLAYLHIEAHRWDVCQFNTMPVHSPFGNELLEALAQRGWMSFSHFRPSLSIRLPNSWDSYLKQLSRKEKEKLTYLQRRLEKRYPARFYKCAQEKERARCLDALFRLHQMHWQRRGEPGSFRSSARRRFYEEMSALFLARRWLEFWLLDLGGEAVAAQFGFRYRDTVFALQEGYNPAYSSDSVGYVLRAYVLKQLIAAGVRRYDFLAGQSHDKTRWGAQPGTYLDIHFARPCIRGGLCLRMLRDIKQAKEWLRLHIPSRAWRLMRRIRSRLGRP